MLWSVGGRAILRPFVKSYNGYQKYLTPSTLNTTRMNAIRSISMYDSRINPCLKRDYPTSSQTFFMRSLSQEAVQPSPGEEDSSREETYFKRIRDAITEKTFCSGTYPIASNDCVLFYGKKGGPAGVIDLSNATDDEFDNLMRICDSATFGQGSVDVLDELYRKAKKLDPPGFSSKFHLGDSGGDGLKSVRAELYKLNIYDRGAFFRAHRDTPRSESMFGSLVVVFPTPHEGGTLTLRHAGKEWSFDSAKAISSQATPSIAYVAFFSDVEHEIAEVTSGHRVTLTYNLYFDSPEAKTGIDSSGMGTPNVHPSEESLKEIFSEMLMDENFLPGGGTLGFELNHHYPVSIDHIDIQAMVHRLKGSDALISRICEHFSLKVDVQVVYEAQSTSDSEVQSVLCPDMADFHFEINLECEGVDKHLINDELGVQVDGGGADTKFKWVTRDYSFNTLKQPFVAYGNEATLGHVYSRLVLIVKVGPVGNRATRKNENVQGQ